MKTKATEMFVLHQTENGYLLRESPQDRLHGRLWCFKDWADVREALPAILFSYFAEEKSESVK